VAELGYGGFLDPPLLRALFADYPEAVLVTADDNMPQNHPLIIDAVGATIATIEPWERRKRDPLVVPEGLSSDECWKREVIARWAHVMAVQELRSKRRYAKERHGEWKPRFRPRQRQLFK
jgi:hypothetical protein